MAGSSLDQNPPNAGRHITAGGSDWLWAVFAVMFLSAFGMILYSFTVSNYIPQQSKGAESLVFSEAKGHTFVP